MNARTLKKIKDQAAARKSKKEKESKVWYEGIAFEVSPDDDIEELKWIYSVFKMDGKNWYILKVATFGMRTYADQMNFKDYRIIRKKGKNTKWSKGEFI